jgi:hypothetical protein
MKSRDYIAQVSPWAVCSADTLSDWCKREGFRQFQRSVALNESAAAPEKATFSRKTAGILAELDTYAGQLR